MRSTPRAAIPTRIVGLLVSSCAWLAAALPFVTDAAVDLLPFYGLMATGAVLSAAWAIALLVGRRSEGAGACKRGALSHMAILSIVITLGITDRDLALRVWLSESGLLSLTAGTRLPTRAALFEVREHDRFGGCERFITTHNFLDDAGIVHCLSGTPPRVGEDRYAPLLRRWWLWNRSW